MTGEKIKNFSLVFLFEIYYNIKKIMKKKENKKCLFPY